MTKPLAFHYILDLACLALSAALGAWPFVVAVLLWIFIKRYGMRL